MLGVAAGTVHGSCTHQVSSDNCPKLLRDALVVHAITEDSPVLKICTASRNASVDYERRCRNVIEVVVDEHTSVQNIPCISPVTKSKENK